MKKFDVLIVYSSRLARSANSLKRGPEAPFAKGSKNESYNTVYSYFLKSCSRVGLTAAFTTSADIVGAGKCDCYWIFEKNTWTKVNEVCYSSVIFDKFSPTNERTKDSRDLLFSKVNIRPFNNPYLYSIFFDKQKTNQKLKRFSIPTVTIKENTPNGVAKAIKSLSRILSRNTNRADFSDEIVLKDRFGAGGINVYKFTFNDVEKIANVLKRHFNKSFIIQPLIKFDQGFKHKNLMVSADIRLIFLEGEIIQTYIRMAKTGDFRCNEHQGGVLKYLSIKKIPNKVINVSKKISKHLNQKSSLYSLDFIVSNNNNIYLIEGNTGPGLDWNLDLKENEIEAKKLIRIVVSKLRTMSEQENQINNSKLLQTSKLPVIVNTEIKSSNRFIQT